MVGSEELTGMNGSGPMGHGSPIQDHGEDAGNMASSPWDKTRPGMAHVALAMIGSEEELTDALV